MGQLPHSHETQAYSDYETLTTFDMTLVSITSFKFE